jgi:hypothetical protein
MSAWVDGFGAGPPVVNPRTRERAKSDGVLEIFSNAEHQQQHQEHQGTDRAQRSL